MKIIILDGSNLVRRHYLAPGQSPVFAKEVAQENTLAQLMSTFRDEGTQIEIYFDGPKRPVWHQDNLVSVFFSKYKKADDLIVNAVAEHAAGYGNEVIVISQDRELQQRCQQYGATIITGNAFWNRHAASYEYEQAAWA